jgi:RimJ/RimL family protein N-acetyltransferase
MSIPVLASFGMVVGLSDHTRDATVAIASVALGAKVIEKHFILDRNIGGPDSFFSLEPEDFRAMIVAVRDTEKALGRPRFGPSKDENASTAFRRSLFVARDVPAGKVLTCDDVRSVRPANGLHPRHMPEVLGRRATRDLSMGTPVGWDMVGPAEDSHLTLRPASHDDSEQLLAWRNDPRTRAASLNTDEVTRDEHERWLVRSLDATDRTVFVAELDGRPVGTVRLDDGGRRQLEVSLTVAPEWRGKGIASQLLHAVEATAGARGAVRLVARIKASNDASVRAFKNAGWYGFTEREGMLACERRIVGYR